MTPFWRPCFLTAGLWCVLHFSLRGEAIKRLLYYVRVVQAYKHERLHYGLTEHFRAAKRGTLLLDWLAVLIDLIFAARLRELLIIG